MMKPLRFFIMALLCAVANVAWGETWIKTDISQLQGNDIIVIVDVTSKLAMPNNNGTSAAPTATEVTLSEDKSKITSTIDGTLQWRFIKNQNNFQFQVPTSTNNYLYINTSAESGSNNCVRVGTGLNNKFVMGQDSDGNAFLESVTTFPRYVGVYISTGTRDWRGYRDVNTNIKETRIAFYKKVADANTVATPTFTPAAGIYTSEQKVTISCGTTGAIIHYTTDGSTPDENSATYTDALTVSSTTTIKAIAVSEGMDNSAVAEATYTFPSTISEVRAMTIGSDVCFKGVVTSSFNGMNFLQDANAAICVYGGQFNVGSEYTVQGTTQNYSGLLQVKSGHTDTEINTGQTVTPEVMTVAETLDNSTITADKQGWLVKIENAVVTAKTNNYTTVKQGESSINVYGISGDYAEKDKITFTGNISYNNNSARIANSKLISVKKAPFLTSSSESVTVPQEGEEGAFDIDTNVDLDNVTTSFNYYESESQETPSTTLPDWLSLAISGNKINYTVNANNGAARSAYFELVLTSSEFDGGKLVSNMVTVTQKAYEAPVEKKIYKKVTSTDEITDGNYLIVYEDEEVAFDGSLETLDAKNNNVKVELDDDFATAKENAAFTINVTDENNEITTYSIKSYSGKFIGGVNASTNGMAVSDNAVDNTIKIDDNKDAVIISNGAYMRFNANSDQKWFRYFKSTTYTNQKAIQLYKEVTPFTLTINSKFTDGNGNYFATISNLGDGNFVIPAGLEVSTITIVDRNIKKTKSFQADDVIPGKDVAYYVVASVEDASAADALTFEFEPTTDAVSDNLEEYDNWLYPAIAGEIITAPSSDVDYLFYKLTTKNGKNPGFYWGAANGAPFEFTSEHKAYLAVPQVDDNNAGLSSIAIDDTNGINDIENAYEQIEEVYTISGMRVKGNLSKGVYIVNGKKQIVK